MEEEIKKLKEDCIRVQDACNLAGVLTAWGRHQNLILRDCVARQINQEMHPANIMFLSKVTSLMRINADCIGSVTKHTAGRETEDDLFGDAYAWAKEG